MKNQRTNTVVDPRILQSLADEEWGDARSYLDELNSTGTIPITQLNVLSTDVTWQFCADEGWSYIENA